jgi:hypothetical protein
VILIRLLILCFIDNILKINPTDPSNFTKALKYTYDIYGKPETTEKGQAGTNYNNNSKYRYVNNYRRFSN